MIIIFITISSIFLASVIPSVGLLGVAWVGCDKVSVLLLLSITGAFGGAVYAGNC